VRERLAGVLACTSQSKGTQPHLLLQGEGSFLPLAQRPVHLSSTQGCEKQQACPEDAQVHADWSIRYTRREGIPEALIPAVGVPATSSGLLPSDLPLGGGGGREHRRERRDLSVPVCFWENRLLVLKDPGQSKFCFRRENELLLNVFLWREMDCFIAFWLRKQHVQRDCGLPSSSNGRVVPAMGHAVPEVKELVLPLSLPAPAGLSWAVLCLTLPCLPVTLSQEG